MSTVLGKFLVWNQLDSRFSGDSQIQLRLDILSVCSLWTAS
jgi:hypothetical protein